MGERSANSPQEVQPRPMIADDAQRSSERVSAGQTVFAGIDRRCPTTTETPPDRSASTSRQTLVGIHKDGARGGSNSGESVPAVENVWRAACHSSHSTKWKFSSIEWN